MSEQQVDVQGWTAKGFEGVRDAFARNFADGSEVGAAFSAYHRGNQVVDLWGGVADQQTGAPWNEDTIVLVYSTTKGMTAICANKLAQEGALDVDALVTEYWPEFGQAGKEAVPVSYLLSHRVGLPDIDGKMSLDDALAWEPVVDALVRQAPIWEPGSQHGYHATTYGWLAGEVVRRISGKSLGTFFHEQVATPLGLSTWIGLPESEEPRVARLIGWGNDSAGDDGGALFDASELDEATRAMLEPLIGPDSLLMRALTAPGGALSGGVWNERAVRAAEIPAANGVSDARSIARMYAACIGEVDGVRLLTEQQVKQATTQLTSGPNVVLMNMDIQFGLGFMLPSTIMEIGGPNGFGHFGAGGSMGWADPDAGFGFGYVMNKMAMGLAGDTRTSSLVNACYAAIA
jgi:CubicO group peptidase (beta-lactamase class C family)